MQSYPKDLPNLILLDLNMPIKDGYETLKDLKQDKQLQTIPVMVLTSSTKPADENVCYQLGCEYFHRKPITLSEYSDLATLIARYSKLTA